MLFVWVTVHGVLKTYFDYIKAGHNLAICVLRVQCLFAPRWTAITGELAWIAMLFIYIPSLDVVRRR